MAFLDGALRAGTDAPFAGVWRDRLALKAAQSCLRLTGRIETVSTLRDAVCLARPTDALGPVGEMFTQWRQITRIPLGRAGWQRRMTAILPDISDHLSGVPATGAPIEHAMNTLSDALRTSPRNEAAALMCADVTLARAMRWGHVVPLLGGSVSGADVRSIANHSSETALRVSRVLTTACDTALRRRADLARRADHLNSIADSLRTKGAAQALAVFLSYDAVAPSGMLSPVIKGSRVPMTDRAARRLCDRLVDLGTVRELTGRPSFRLYGI